MPCRYGENKGHDESHAIVSLIVGEFDEEEAEVVSDKERRAA